MMDPAHNNMPLHFNKNKNKPPMPVTITNNDVMNEDGRPTTTTHSFLGNSGRLGDDGDQGGAMMGMCSVGNMIGPMVGPIATNPNVMMMNPMFGNLPTGQMQGPMIGPGQMSGPGMSGHVSNNMMNPQGMMAVPPQGMMPAKEIITLKSCILYPPAPGAPPRVTRPKPVGCRTIFTGNLPQNTTEDILEEIFENCGPIHRVRMHKKKKFAHIRFENPESVEEALYISGFKMKINDSDAAEDTGRIHIDYAEAREDQYEYECMQRAMAREMRHYQRLEEERNRPPSPPPVVCYSEHDAALLLERMRSEEEFMQASQTLITWLERGECNRRTANTFYSLVQNANGCLRRVTNEMQTINLEFENYKIQHQQRLQGVVGQICQVERVLASAHKQRCWDHFTKAQRKCILTWQRQAQEIRESQDNDSSSKTDNVGINDDMELSDDEMSQQPVAVSVSSGKKRVFSDSDCVSTSETKDLKEENDHLKCQVEAFKNEVDSARLDAQQESGEKDKQIKALQNALQGMQQQLIAQRASVSTLTEEKEDLEKKLKTMEETHASNKEALSNQVPSQSFSNKEEVVVTSTGLSISDKEAKMIGLVSCFLHVHPCGATVDYLWSYLSQLMTVRVREVEDLLEKMPSIFEQKIVGVGAAIERKWMFIALKNQMKS